MRFATRKLRALGSRKMRMLRIVPPTPQQDRDGLAIPILVRDVAPYVVEWLQFHHAAGARHFFIYDNGSTDDTLALLQPFVEQGLVTVLPWKLVARDAETGRQFNAQISAFAHAIMTFGMNFQRFAFIDIDEFIVPKHHLTIMDAVYAAGNPVNLSLGWHMFGHSNHETSPLGGVIRNFTQRARLPYKLPTRLLQYKCIVDPCEVTLIHHHEFETLTMRDNSSNAVGKVSPNGKRKSLDYFTSDNLQLNHYFCLSRQETDEKINRGSATFETPEQHRERILKFVREIENETEHDVSAIKFLERSASKA
ncbi:glycosyltransferase family 92 protein [Thioclava sp. UBA3469]|uniref:glycosyltransferase family 92 protein n=1 Tax=Thioclava sp. UBA3469 TaxID=1947693 RepID=UPI000C52D41B|nr:glycosyltransferase family 92 protein [Thioclava sp. UBA3469]MAQ36088.1 glycosyltransferase [Thioclava sp.]